jgi:sugar phosphate isomerase/epimerase
MVAQLHIEPRFPGWERKKTLAPKSVATKKSTKSKSPGSWVDRGLRVSVFLPYRMVRQKIGFLRKAGLGLEIIEYDTNWICNFPAGEVAELADLLKESGIHLTVHGPIHDLNPGSLDVVIRDYTRHCYFKTLALCHALGADALVLHLGVNPLLPESALDEWLDTSVRTWEPIVDMAEQMGLTIRLENMFVPTPRFLVDLKERLTSEAVKICFDICHFKVYSNTSLSHWLDQVGEHVEEVHLSDSNGLEDIHLTLGRGKIDFRGFFDELSTRGINPQFTIEMHSDKFQSSLRYLDRNDLLAPFAQN